MHTFNERNKIYDYIFICLIPATFSPNLVDLSFDGINEMITSQTSSGLFISGANPDHKSKIEHYFRMFRNLFDNGAQVYTISTHLRYFNDFYRNEMKIFLDGRIYICYKYKQFDKKEPSLDMDTICNKTGYRYLLTTEHKALGLELQGYYTQNLEAILKIICFAFHPECKHQIVNYPSEFFQGIFILPFMRFNGKNRLLKHSDGLESIGHLFELGREYGGDQDDIVYMKSFKYDEISTLVDDFKNWAYGFFRTKSDTSFS